MVLSCSGSSSPRRGACSFQLSLFIIQPGWSILENLHLCVWDIELHMTVGNLVIVFVGMTLYGIVGDCRVVEECTSWRRKQQISWKLWQLTALFMFVYPCIASIIVNDAQQDATILAYLFIPNHLCMFRAMYSPVIRSTWLYLQLLVFSIDIAACWCHGWDGTSVPSHPWRQPSAISVDNTRSCKYSQVLLMMGEDIARNMQSWWGINK